MSDDIGNRLKQLRIEHNFTQKQIANYLNLNQEQIVKLEKNKIKLNHKSLISLCNLYSCSPNYILKGEGNYSVIDFGDKSNLDLESIAEMNKIINNLEFLSRFNK